MNNCEHKEIVVYNYACKKHGQVYEIVGLGVRCKYCEEILSRSERESHESVLEYLDKNKTCFTKMFNMSHFFNLEKELGIPDGFEKIEGKPRKF